MGRRTQTPLFIKYVEINSFEVDEAHFPQCIYNVGSMDIRVSNKTRGELVAWFI